MATTKTDIRGWLLRAQSNGATHVIVACDTFDMTDYPVEVEPDEDVRAKVAETEGKVMTKIMEVYNLALPLEEQLNQMRVWNL
jgi:hypothetical protein